MTIELSYEVEGPAGAPILVLLNALGTDSSMWAAPRAALTEHFQVICVDTRGHGRSPAASSQPCTIGDLGDDVLALLDRLEVRRAHFAGVSLGAMVALSLAIHHPERVDRLALICTSAHLTPSSSWATRAAIVREQGFEAIAEVVVARWITPDLANRDAALLRNLRDQIFSSDPESYAQCCEAIGGMDQTPDLSRVTAPTLVVSGAQDLAIPPAHGQVLATGITGARLELIEDAAHLLTLEQPGPLTALLLGHLHAGATLAAGYRTRRAVLGAAHVDRTIANTTELGRPFQEFITRYAWGDVWSRPGLGRRERSIATLAALVALGAEHELTMHVRAAMRNGLTQAQIGEVLLHTALYAGLPRANRALALAADVMAELDAGAPQQPDGSDLPHDMTE